MINKVIRGADVKVIINGRTYPYITGLRFSASTNRRAISGIDQLTPFELAPGSTTIKGSLDLIRIRASGGLEGGGMTAPESQTLLEKYFSIIVIDRVTDTVILNIPQASIGDQSWNVQSKGIMTGSASFEGMGWVNEVEF